MPHSQASAHNAFSPPRVSLIVTNHNYARFLRDAVDSVFRQSYPFIECIIVDDASTDESPKVLDEIGVAYPQARIIRQTVNGGQNATTLAGLAASTGEYVMILDADDLLLDTCVATHVYVHLSLRRPVGFTCSDMIQISNRNMLLSTFLPVSENILASKESQRAPVRPLMPMAETAGAFESVDPSVLANLYMIEPTRKAWPWSATSAFFYRRDALNIWAGVPGLAEIRHAADAYFGYGINALSGSVVIDRALSVYRIHGKNIFTRMVPLNRMRTFEPRCPGDKTLEARNLLLDHATANAPKVAALFWSKDVYKTMLETLDDDDADPQAPAWAYGKRLTRRLFTEFDALAAVFGRRFVIDWMASRSIPLAVIRQAGVSVTPFDKLRGFLFRHLN